MPPRHIISPLAIPPPENLELDRSLSPPLLLRTDFDYYSAWVAACRRDDLEGDKEAEENPDDLLSEPGEPDDLADFDDPFSEDEDERTGATDFSSPLTTPPSTPMIQATYSSSAQSPHTNGTSNIIAPTPYKLADVTSIPIAPLCTPLSPTPNISEPTANTASSRKRHRSAAAIAKNRERKDKKRRTQTSERRREERLPVHGDAYVQRYLKADTISREFDVLDLEAVRGGDTGKVGRRTMNADTPVTLEGAEDEGNDRFDWDGIRTTYILDRTNKISVTCVGMPIESDGRPYNKTWVAGMARLAMFLEDTRQKHESKLSAKARANRRGPFPGVSVGFTRGSGSKDVHNLKHRPEHQAMVQELVENFDSKRLVSFQSEALAAHYPKAYCDLKQTTQAIFDRHPDVKPMFPSHSVYPGCTFNLGPHTVTSEHVDPGNKPSIPCAITSLGPYDPDKGGHFFLPELKLIIRFPPGATILISSASLRHASLPIQPGEKRYSVTQFCPGGLYRWVRNGFRPACTLSKARRRALDGDPVVRWREGWALLSTPQSLKADRWRLVEQEKRWLEERKAKKVSSV